MTSSAAPAPIWCATNRHTSAWLVRMAAASAVRSPSRAATNSSVMERPVMERSVGEASVGCPCSSTARRTLAGNFQPIVVDYPYMICDRIQLSISAALDGEDAPEPAPVVDAHLASCADCRAYRDGAQALHREVRVASAPPVPDLTPGILLAIGAEPRDTDARGLRLVVGLLGSAAARRRAPGPALRRRRRPVRAQRPPSGVLRRRSRHRSRGRGLEARARRRGSCPSRPRSSCASRSRRCST